MLELVRGNMSKITMALLMLVGTLTQIPCVQVVFAQTVPPPKPDPAGGGPSDGGKGSSQGFSVQPIAPLRDGSNYWPGYMLVNSGQAGGEIKACYIVTPSADLGDSKLVGQIPKMEQVFLLCSKSEGVGKLPTSP